MVYRLSLEDLPMYQSNGAILIDVRDLLEYNQGHLNGAINVPYEKILEGTKDYSKDAIIILYCSTGRRSKIASNLLVSMGFRKVYDMGKVSL